MPTKGVPNPRISWQAVEFAVEHSGLQSIQRQAVRGFCSRQSLTQECGACMRRTMRRTMRRDAQFSLSDSRPPALRGPPKSPKRFRQSP